MKTLIQSLAGFFQGSILASPFSLGKRFTLASLVLLAATPLLRAAEIRKADNANNLNLGSSWLGGVAPASADVARWDLALTSANTVALGADLSWAGMRMIAENPVTISSGNTLTLGASGIDMSQSGDDLTINANLFLGSDQTWDVRQFLTFGGTASGTGNLTVKGAGFLTLNYSAQDTSKIPDTAVLTLGGGLVTLSGGTHSEVVGSTTIASGTTSIATNGAPGQLQLNTITRNVGGTLDLAANGIASCDSANNNVNGIIGGWLTVGGTTWGTKTDGDDQPITGLPDGSYTTTIAAGNNVSLAAVGTLNFNGGACNSLRLTAAVAMGVSGGSSGTGFTITSGGVLVTGPNACSIASGSTRFLIGPSGKDLIFNIQNAGGSLTINNSIGEVGQASAGFGVTKTGSGTLTLNSNAGQGDGYTGVTTINGGTLTTGTSTSRQYISGDLVVNPGGTFLHGAGDNQMTNANVTVNASTYNLNARSEFFKSLTLNGGNLTGFVSGKTLTITNTGTSISATSGFIDANVNALGDVTKTTDQALTIRRTTTIAGSFAIQNGIVQLGTNNTTTANLILGNSTTSGKLILGDAAGPATITVTNSFATNGAGNAIVGGTISSNSQFILSFGYDTNFNIAYLGGAGANENNLGFTKGGAGIMSLIGSPSYNGNTTNSAGTLRMGVGVEIPSGAGKGNLTVNGGLDLNGAGAVVNGLFGSGTISNGVSSTSGYVNLGNNNATASWAGTIVDGAGSVEVRKLGTGNQTFTSPNNTYSGNTFIEAGLLSIDGDATLGTATVRLLGGTLNTTASRTVSANPVPNAVQLDADSAVTTTSTAGTVDLNFTSDSISGSAGTLTFRNDGADAAADQFEPRFSGVFTFGRPIVIDNGAIGKTRLSSFNTNGTTQTFNGVISGNGGFRRSFGTGSGGVTVFPVANTYSGDTAVNSGTLLINGSIATGAVTVNSPGVLGGTGTINGPVTVVSGTLSAGASIGTLSISNSLTFQGGTNLVEINKNTSSKDLVQGLTSVTYGGTLSVSLLGGSFAANDSFKIFDAVSYSGSFTNIVPATPGAGLVWDTSSLTNNGTLKVATAPAGQPQIGGTTLSGSNFIISGSSGPANGGFTVLTSTDVALALASWTVLTNGTFDGSGNFSVTNTYSAGDSQRFYSIRIP